MMNEKAENFSEEAVFSVALKPVPCSESSWRTIREKNLAWADKTRFIEVIESFWTRFPMIVRPKGFGKTLAADILAAYYDRAQAADFERLFSDTWIGRHKTPLAGKYCVLRFDFSELSASNAPESFCSAVRAGFMDFLERYPSEEAQSVLGRPIGSPAQLLEEMLLVLKPVTGQTICVIIDAYDSLASEMLASSDGRRMTARMGFIRQFYGRIKAWANWGTIARVCIMGSSGASLDMLTPGFTVAVNISSYTRFAGSFGLTDDDLRALIPQVISLERFGMTLDALVSRLKALYGGYRFSHMSEETVCNPAMCLGYLRTAAAENQEPAELSDPVCGKASAELDILFRSFPKDAVRATVEAALRHEPLRIGVLSEIYSLSEDWRSLDDMRSLLAYMGFLTYVPGDPQSLVVPNWSAAQQLFDGWVHLQGGAANVPRPLPEDFA